MKKNLLLASIAMMMFGINASAQYFEEDCSPDMKVLYGKWEWAPYSDSELKKFTLDATIGHLEDKNQKMTFDLKEDGTGIIDISIMISDKLDSKTWMLVSMKLTYNITWTLLKDNVLKNSITSQDLSVESLQIVGTNTNNSSDIGAGLLKYGLEKELKKQKDSFCNEIAKCINLNNLDTKVIIVDNDHFHLVKQEATMSRVK